MVFRLDEFAKYDTPAFIDKALELSGQNYVYWIGHSQGTVVGFMTLADIPEYNKRVSHAHNQSFCVLEGQKRRRYSDSLSIQCIEAFFLKHIKI